MFRKFEKITIQWTALKKLNSRLGTRQLPRNFIITQPALGVAEFSIRPVSVFIFSLSQVGAALMVDTDDRELDHM